MIKRWMAVGLGALLILSTGCDEGIDDWNSSAKISGWVYADNSHTGGVEGVQVILEADPEADEPYTGPDRWTLTNGSGHFEGAVFLGNKKNEGGGYNYVADLSVSYFYRGQSFSWTGGVTVGPGSTFTLPPVDLSMFR
jgi:hypothetical protein